ncbi:MAG TPA: hypothetical protein VFP21_01860 [Solirubrobacterales bacterium]|nr:hypothetical protein [Solirubrobacterales bacterium]
MLNFSILRATRAESPGTIPLVNRKELSEVVAEAAARTERAAARTETARADIEVSRAGIEAARKRQEEAVARQEEAVARQEAAVAKAEESLIETRATKERRDKEFQEHVRRMEAMIAEDRKWTKKIFAELDDQRDERRALIEALLEMIDRLPPPPPQLRSA